MTEREQLASLIEKFLQSELNSEANLETFVALRRSSSKTIVYGCEILADHFDDVEYDVDLFDKSEWDYLERVRLSVLGGATIRKVQRTKFSWRNALAGIGFLAFLLIAVSIGVGYYLLVVSFLLGLATLAVANRCPVKLRDTPYHSIITPFRSFEDLNLAYDSVDGFTKLRHRNCRGKTRESSLSELVNKLSIGIFLSVFTPVILIGLSMPDTTPTYEACFD